MQQAWSEIVLGAAQDVMKRLALVAPRLFAMLTLLLLGWLIAVLLRRLAIRVFQAAQLDARCARWGVSSALGRWGVRNQVSELLGRLVFWTFFLIGLLMGIEALEMPGTAGAVGVVLSFLPNAIIALLVMVGGWVLAHFLAEAMLIAAVNAQVAGAPLLAAAVRWLVLAFAGAVAVTQLGIAREMVLLVFGIAFGGAVLALALAFGLGARDLARQALEAQLRKYEPEDTDRISHV